MEKTGIIWTEKTWNPVSGCKKITAGCAFCYADTIAQKYAGQSAYPNGFGLTLRPHKLKDPYRWKEPSIVFVNSMSDLFWDEIPADYLDRIMQVMIDTPQHQYQILTKRPERQLEYSLTHELPPNYWAGTTIENAKNLHRLEILKQTRAGLKFVSFEPLLDDLGDDYSLEGIDWVIVGGESGNHLFEEKWNRERALVEPVAGSRGRWRPKKEAEEWVRKILAKCRESGTHFFFKQWGGHYPEAGGRLLDGKTYNEIPRFAGNKREINNDYLKMLEKKRTTDPEQERIFPSEV